MTKGATDTDRSKRIGGSDIAAILGISPWKTAFQLWQDKTQPAMRIARQQWRARIETT